MATYFDRSVQQSEGNLAHSLIRNLVNALLWPYLMLPPSHL